MKRRLVRLVAALLLLASDTCFHTAVAQQQNVLPASSSSATSSILHVKIQPVTKPVAAAQPVVTPTPVQPNTPAPKPAPVAPVAVTPAAPAPAPVAAPATPVAAAVTSSQCGDNFYAHYIYEEESGCRTTVINSEGCLGLGQACPASKLEAVCPDEDYTCENNYFTNYALSRYGSWALAYAFHIAHNWW